MTFVELISMTQHALEQSELPSQETLNLTDLDGDNDTYERDIYETAVL